MAFRRQSSGRQVRLGSSAPYQGGRPGGGKRPAAGTLKSSKVFCGNLSWDVTADILKRHMEQVGQVVSCEIMMGRDGRSKGGGLVHYKSMSSASRALSELHDSELLGRLLLVREDREAPGLAAQSPTLVASARALAPMALHDRQIPGDVDSRRVWVGNLEYRVSWQDLKDHMRTAGDVIRVEVLTGADGRSRGCALVEFASADGARNAIATLHDTQLNGRALVVRQDKDDTSRRVESGHTVATDRWLPPGSGDHSVGVSDNGAVWVSPGGVSGSVGSNRVYVGNLAYEVSWQDLKDHMRTAGEVLRANLLTMPDGKRSKGCGIVEFADQASAQNAIHSLTNTVLKGRQIFVREDREEKKLF